MVSASEQLTNSHPNSSKCGGGFEGEDILLSLLLEVQKGFLEDTELQLLSEGGESGQHVQGRASAEACGGWEHPAHVVSRALAWGIWGP